MSTTSENNDLCRIEKLNSADGWNIWKFQIKVLLNDIDAFDIVNGTRMRPNVTPENGNVEEITKFMRLDAKAQKIIVTTIGQQPMLHIINCNTSHEMWLKLVSIYEQKSKTSIHLLQQKFYSFTKIEEDDMATHISKLQSIVQQLKDLGETISDSMVVTKILMTLPSEFSHFITAWESTTEEDQTLEKLTQRLLMEESRFTSKTVESSVALVTKMYHKRNQRGSEGKPGKCFNCNQSGHWRSNCPKEAGNPSNSRAHDEAKRSNRNTQMEDKPSNRHTNGRGTAFVGEVVSKLKYRKRDKRWILDTGASDHMSFKLEWFSNYVRFSVPISVKIGDGKHIPALGYGDIEILAFNGDEWCRSYLEGVLYVPDLHVNLFATVSALDKGVKLMMDKEKCQLQKDNVTVGVGYRENRLFKLEFKVISKQSQNHVYLANRKPLPLRVWHERLSHQNVGHVENLLKTMNVKYKKENQFFCESCVMGKHHRLPFNRSQSKSVKVGDLTHSDVCGPIEVKSLGGARYFVLFKDDFSHFRTVYFIKQKSEVAELVKKYMRSMKSDMSCSVVVFRSDNGLEYINKNVKSFFESYGITHQTTVAYTPEQNGRAEREMRTIVEAARTLIHSKNLPVSFWAEAVNTAVYVLNRTGTSPIKNKTPYELLYKKKPVIDHLRIFGSTVYTHIPKQRRKKWNVKAKKGILVGYCENTKGYRVWIAEEKAIEIARDVIVRENESDRMENVAKEKEKGIRMDKFSDEPISHASSENEVIDGVASEDSNAHEDSSGSDNDKDVENGYLNESEESSEAESIIDLTNGASSRDSTIISNTDQSIVDSTISTIYGEHDSTWSAGDDTLNGSEAGIVNRSFHLRSDNNATSNYSVMFEAHAFVVGYNEPISYENALTSTERYEWIKAMDDEYRSLCKNQTWDLVTLPPGRKVIDNKWVYKIKNKPTGQIERFKARLVIRGFTQKFGVDYGETFSPVVKLSSIRMVLATAAAEGLQLKKIDVKTAFLYGELKEEIYMKQPRGYDDNTGRVCKLNKSLYGLKQASRVWNNKFTNFLRKFNLQPCDADNCVFVNLTGQSKIIVAIWVDDGLVAARDSESIDQLKNFLREEIEITEESLDYFLGMEISRSDNGSIHINQSAHVRKIIEKFRLQDATPVSTPADATILSTGEYEESSTNFPYREAVVSLMYLSIATRPDITYAMGMVSRHLNNPKMVHVNAVKRIFKYLKATESYGINFEKNANASFICYSDSDYAGDPDTKRSTSGNVFLFGSSAVSWNSQRQKCVALSSTEAEYVSASMAIQEMVWLKQLVIDMSTDCEIPRLYLDNQSAIRLIKNPEHHQRTKHIDVKYHFIREKYAENFFSLWHVSSDNQIADIFTKPLPKDKFQRFRSLMGMCSKQVDS